MRLSISKIKSFKSCRRAYELHYVEGLTPVKTPDALAIGSSYHELLEKLNKTGVLEDSDNLSMEMAMAHAYQKYVYPKFKVVEAEKWVEMKIGGDTLVGIVDGVADDGHIVEHKTTGIDSLEEYEFNLQWDEQILAYMYLTGQRKVWYTVCRKPTIRQKKNETEQEFYERMIAWYDEDTENKIRLIELERTDEEVEKFGIELMTMLNVMKEAEAKKLFYRNTCHCSMWGRRCEYSSICLNYDPNQEYIDFVKGE